MKNNLSFCPIFDSTRFILAWGDLSSRHNQYTNKLLITRFFFICAASRLEPDYSNYLREGKIFTMIVGIVAELSEPPKSPLLINLESRTLSNEKIPLEFHDFEKLLKEGLLSDITLKIHGERLKVHKNILASRSPRFLEMFANVDAGKSELEIKDFNYISMKEMLRFVYTGQVRDLGELHAKQLLKIANKFAIASLLPKTQDLLCKYLNVGNAVEMLKLADTYGADRVKNEAMSIIMNNMQKIDETNLMTLKPELLTRILLGVSKMNDKLVKSRDMLIWRGTRQSGLLEIFCFILLFYIFAIFVRHKMFFCSLEQQFKFWRKIIYFTQSILKNNFHYLLI